MTDYFPWQADIWHRLNERRTRLPHALLFQGRAGVGKLAFAQAFAQGLLCESPREDGRACGRCLACGWFEQGSHPDFRPIQPESGSEGEEEKESKGRKGSHQIVIEQVREIASLMNLSTHRNGMRVVLIHPAEAMNASAANGLLKTLEEPPPNTVLILVTHRPQNLLPTVRSRCRKVEFPLPDQEQAGAWLKAQGVSDTSTYLAQAGRAPIAALELASDHEQEARRSFLGQLARVETLDPIVLAEKHCKLPLPSLVRWLQQWIYDIIGCRLSGQIRYQPDMAAEISSLASRIGLREALALQRELLLAQKNVHHPLNAQLLLEQLLLSYAEMTIHDKTHG